MKRPILVRAAVVASFLVLTSLTPVANAQRPFGPGGRGGMIPPGVGLQDELGLDGVFLPPDRATRRKLETAQEMIDAERYGEAVRLLGSLLEGSEDYFFKPQAEQPVYRSLKAEAGRLIAALPKQGRESYELQYGARARALLKQAAANGSLAELAEISRQFFYTQAGQEATYLLGRCHLDQNRPLAAALCFERLLETGEASEHLEPALSLSLAACWLRASRPVAATETLRKLRSKHPGDELVLGGRTQKWSAGETQVLAWLNERLSPLHPSRVAEAGEWTLFRGNEARNAVSPAGQPLLSVRWRQRTTDDRSVEKFVARLRQDYLSQQMVAMPAFHPLAVGDVVLMRTAFSLQAVDFDTGKLVWKYPTSNESLEQFTRVAPAQQNSNSTQNLQIFSALDQRVWEDATYGTMASDGELVYYVEDLGLGLGTSPAMTVGFDGRRLTPGIHNTNRLAARELKTEGKLKWSVGSISGDDEPKLAGAFFLGPPLPLMGHLYALVELKGQEVRLVALSPKTGALEWSQQLAVVDEPVLRDLTRRNAGVTPSFADGVLVCPTAAGAVVAIDLTTRSLLWGYQYRRNQQTIDRFTAMRLPLDQGERRAGERWADGCVTIADGRVLVTPVESDWIHCLNLLDGRELWKLSRGAHLYVACVHKGKVILVDRSTVTAFNLSDGKMAWDGRFVTLPSLSLPSGRGYYSGDSYYLPLTTAEVLKIDLDEGRIERRARSRTGTIPGNLVSYRGSIISQSAENVDVFYQLEFLQDQVAKTLGKRPDDAQALAALADMKLDAGELGEAIDLLRRSYKFDADPQTREQLVDCLLDGLKLDFAKYRGSLGELEQLIEQPRQRLLLLRHKAVGLQAASETAAAFEAYLSLIDADELPPMEKIDESLSTRRDRWIRSRLKLLSESASAEDARKIDAEIDRRLNAALEAGTPEALRNFLSFFGHHPSATQARQTLVTRLGPADLLECETLVRELEATADREAAGPAVAQLAVMLAESGRADFSAYYYRKLNDRYADVAVRSGKTGRELFAQLPPTGLVRKRLDADTPWPTGKVESETHSGLPRGVPTRPSRVTDLEIRGQLNSPLAGVSMYLEPVGGQSLLLVGQDGLGGKPFRVPVSDNRFLVNQVSQYIMRANGRATVDGGLVMLAVGNHVIAVDLLSSDRMSPVIWSQDVGEQAGGLPGPPVNMSPNTTTLAWGGKRYTAQDGGIRYGYIGPVRSDGVVFQRRRDLFCVDPLSGKTLWQRKDLGPNHDLFGDEEILVAASPNEELATILRVSTGEILAERRYVPGFNRRMTTIGRRILCWEPQPTVAGLAAPIKLRLRDPWEDRIVWEHSFDGESRAAFATDDAVAVMQKDNGRFMLIRLEDGKPLVDTHLEPSPRLTEMYLIGLEDSYMVVANTPATFEPGTSATAFPNAPEVCPLVNGRLYGFDRTSGKPLWEKGVEIKQYGLLLTQPSALPVLIFTKMLQRTNSQTGPNDPRLGVMCIDKRNGQTVYDQLLPLSNTGTIDIQADTTAYAVTITIPPTQITLNFTARAAAIESPAAATAHAP